MTVDRPPPKKGHMKRPSTRIVAMACMSVFLLALATGAHAIPRYSTRYDQNCNLCHANPTGGGLRNLYATKFIIPEELTAKRLDPDVLAGIEPDLTDNLLIGADFRMIHFYSDEPAETKNFFQMQGDIYLNFQMGSKLSLYFDTGINQTYELFGLGYYLPWNGYLKAGRFTPDYGWKFSDHTMFVREHLGFFPPRHTDAGVEAGIYPGNFLLTASVVNGNAGSTFDENQKVGAVARGAYRFKLFGTALLLGASGYTNPTSTAIHDAAGGFWSFNWSRFVWLGEVDWMRENSTPGDTHTTGLVASNEFTYQYRQGMDVKATWDFYDPDWNFQTGSKNRYGGGGFVYVNPFVSFEVLVRYYDISKGVDIIEDSYWETVVHLHMMY